MGAPRCRRLATGLATGLAAVVAVAASQIAHANARSDAQGGAPTVLRVNVALASGGNNGSSWSNAFQGRLGVQNALTASASISGPVEIWVAKGTYAPAAAGGAVSATFALRDDVAVLGGFAGGESSSEERNFAANPTVLTGDLNNNDGPGIPTGPDKVRHVVTAASVGSSAALDGVIVERGRAPSGVPGPDTMGGGLYCTNASPVIRACTLRLNFGGNGGGGAYVEGGAPAFTGCTFMQNQSPQKGGGMLHAASAAATLDQCTFDANGGGRGSGLFLTVASQPGFPWLRACAFKNHAGSISVPSGAGIYSEGGSPRIHECSFVNNATPSGGGGIYLQSSNADVRNCDFVNNRGTNDGGGAMYIENSGAVIASPVIAGCRFVGNNGALFLGMAGVATATNCTLANNSFGFGAQSWPAVLGTGAGVQLTMNNCVLWGNAQIFQSGFKGTVLTLGGATVTANWCSMQFYSGTLPGQDSNANSPLFIDADGADNTVGTLDDDVHLGPGSLCIDSGSNAAVPSGLNLDFAGQPRIVNGDDAPRAVVDRGCLEHAETLQPADLNHDGAVDGADLGALLGDWGGGPSPADLDGNGLVDGADLGALLAAWTATAN